MGCSASIPLSPTIQSKERTDMSANTTEDQLSSRSAPPKSFIDASTQTIVSDVSHPSEQTDLQMISKSEDEPVEWMNGQNNPRFIPNSNDREELRWILTGFDATQFNITHQSMIMTMGVVTPAIVVGAMKKDTDLRTIPTAVWNLLQTAADTADITYLIRAYTAESDLYRILNQKLAREDLGNPPKMTMEGQMISTVASAFSQFNQAISLMQNFQAGQSIQLHNDQNTDWSKLFLKALHQLIMIPNSTLRYQGLTYRGMRLTIEELVHYDGQEVLVCNKAITSTSKLRSVAQGFIDSSPRPQGMFDVMFIYSVKSVSALLALDVHTLSIMKHEEEVLIMPGILFKVDQINVISPGSLEIQLKSALEDLENGQALKSFIDLFSMIQAELD